MAKVQELEADALELQAAQKEATQRADAIEVARAALQQRVKELEQLVIESLIVSSLSAGWKLGLSCRS